MDMSTVTIFQLHLSPMDSWGNARCFSYPSKHPIIVIYISLYTFLKCLPLNFLFMPTRILREDLVGLNCLQDEIFEEKNIINPKWEDKKNELQKREIPAKAP